MWEEKTKVVTELLEEYDYIIVGGGAAGCVLANRLTEDDDVTVLLLEAGGDDAGYDETWIPTIGCMKSRAEMKWPYFPESQKHACKGLVNNTLEWPCGRVLGGGSVINFLVWMRGVPGDYDLWEQMGCEGWGYKDVLPYFLKSENMTTPHLADNGNHSTGGPISITEVDSVTPIGAAFLEGVKELGYRHVDCNSADPFGFMKKQCNIGDGVRQSISRTYLRPVMQRNNLYIAINTIVTKLILENKTVVGVQAIMDGKRIGVKARKEVILSAGAIQSPKILMLSGIGPRDHLESLGIPLISDAPVGNSLTDHVGIRWPGFTIDKPVSSIPAEVDTQETRDIYHKSKSGPLSMPSIGEVVGYLPEQGTASACVANVELGLGPSPVDFVQPTGTLSNLKKEIFEMIYDLPTNTHGFLIYTFVSHPKSIGTLRLRSTNHEDYPVIDPNYLADERDVEALLEGVKFVLKLTKTKPFQEMGTRLIQKGILPGFKRGDEETDDYIREMARTFTSTTYHYVATCKMGAITDPTSVVDPELSVKGVSGLRVVDGGVIPEQVSGNTLAAVVMLAEKAADIIRGRKHSAEDLK